jgi:TRAP-type uncharacterized transport system substrate-binding protein
MTDSVPSAEDGSRRKHRGRRLRLIQLGLVLGAVVLALTWIKPATPAEVWLLTGPEGSTFHRFGKGYAEFLEEHGVKAHVVVTAGSHENLGKLRSIEGQAVAFTHSGIGLAQAPGESVKGFVSLASLSYEPLWVFVRAGVQLESLADLETRGLTVGLSGGGSKELATVIFKANNLQGKVATRLLGAGTPDSTLAGCDAVFAVGSPGLDSIDRLLADVELAPRSFDRAAAYAWQFQFLGRVTVPEGAIDLGRNRPATDLSLLAAVAQLVSRSDLHPALVDLLLDAARKVHRAPPHFADQGKFPGMDHVSLPLDPNAERYFTEGHSTLRKILPYRLATLVDRFLAAIAAVAGVLVAVFTVLPRLIVLPIQISLNKALKRMVQIEMSSANGADPKELLARLDELDAETVNYRVPLSRLAAYLDYRQRIFDTRERIRGRGE